MNQNWGRQGRKARREQAREMAKLILQDSQRPPRAIGWPTVGAIASILCPLGWEEFMSDGQPWRVVIGWLLWLVPVSLGTYVFWSWTDKKPRWRFWRVISLIVAAVIFISSGAYSIRKSYSPEFVLVYPGLALQDGQTRIYYYAAKRRPIYNSKVIVFDRDPDRSLSFQREEIDPRTGGFAESFLFSPSNIGHERLQIIVQSRGIDIFEELAVQTRGPYLFPAFRAVVKNGRNGSVIFQCQSKDYPEHADLQDCMRDTFGGQ